LMLLALPANSVNFEMDKVHPIVVFDNFPSVEIKSFPELDLPDLQAILRASPSCHIEDSHWNRMIDNIELVESCSLRMEQKDKIIEMLSLADDALVRKILHKLLCSKVFRDSLPNSLGRLLVKLKSTELIILLLENFASVPEEWLVDFIKLCCCKPEEIEDDESPLSKILYYIVQYKYSSSVMCDELKTLNAEQTLIYLKFLNRHMVKLIVENEKSNGNRSDNAMEMLSLLLDAKVACLMRNFEFLSEIEFCRHVLNTQVNIFELRRFVQAAKRSRRLEMRTVPNDYRIEKLILFNLE
ncbi:hypothetical protein T02_12587, partial [Trichinella nativa]